MRIHLINRLSLRNYLTSISILVFSLFSDSYSQEIEPRNYSNIPKNFNLVGATYSLSQGNVIADATSPVQDLDLTAHSITATYLRSFSLFGRLAKVQASLPYVFLSGTAKLRGVDTGAARSGFGDSRVKLTVNIFGSPTLSPKDFVKFNQELIFGASLVMSIPTGYYLPDKLINIGTNRWGVKPEIGLSNRIGNFYFEIYSGVWFFTDNKEFLKTNTLSQDPVLSFQGHISYQFPSKIWVALDGGYADGGETTLNGTLRNDFQKNWRAGGTLSIPFDMHSSVRLMYHTGVVVRTGQDASIYLLTYQYSWF